MMARRLAKPLHDLQGRGVWVAPWLGPDGETILVAITRDKREARKVYVPQNVNPQPATDELWDTLAVIDPGPMPM